MSQSKRGRRGKQPTDRVRVWLWLREPQLPPDEERRLATELGGTRLVMTAFLASVEIAVEQIEAVAGLPSVIQVR
ncbi:MAG: hypothetical protein U0736_03810 [Gemmataceae bacterium]